jgi:hypothetical protein
LAKWSIFETAPRLTILPISMASAIGYDEAPLCSANVRADSRHGWQLAEIAAPTEINALM